LEKDFDPSLVIRNIKNYSEGIETTYKHNIGIIPNYRLFDRGGMLKDDMLGFYHSIIERNVADGSYCYYLIAHAGEDLQICRWIKELFADCDNVVLIDHVLSSFNYENFAKKLNFIVASRYHAIVHAYKEGTPAVIIGWADKYETVASIFNQNKYIVDTKHLDEGTKIFDQMVRNYTVEREYILNKLPEVQATSCYDFLDKLKVDS
jgi:colanic acid/amylovoran biosynthesis protein